MIITVSETYDMPVTNSEDGVCYEFLITAENCSGSCSLWREFSDSRPLLPPPARPRTIFCFLFALSF